MNEIKDIFMDSFSLQPLDATRPILEQLSDIVDQVNNEDHDTNAKLMEWLEKKFQGKVNQKIANDIILGQVDLAKKLDRVEIVLGNIFSLYSKLCDFLTAILLFFKPRICSFFNNEFHEPLARRSQLNEFFLNAVDGGEWKRISMMSCNRT